MVNTQYQIHSDYQTAVESYVAAEQSDTPYPRLDYMIEMIAQRIITANGQRERYGQASGVTPFPLSRACYVTVQALDKREGKDTPKLIREATESEKKIFKYVSDKLRADYFPAENVNETDFTAATLLFGMPLVHEFAVSGIAPQRPLSILENIARELVVLVKNKAILEVQGNNPNVRAVLNQIEQVIAQKLPQLQDPETGEFRIEVDQILKDYAAKQAAPGHAASL